MTESSRSSMAAVLSVIMTVLMWVLAVGGGLIFVIFGFGYLASLSGGEITTPVVSTFVDGFSSNRILLMMLGIAAPVTVAVYICAQVRKILSTLAMGDPFVPENASRLRKIAIAVAVMESLRYLAMLLALTLPNVGEVEKAPSLLPNVAAVVAILVLFVLAQVFKEGARLRAEEKMTI